MKDGWTHLAHIAEHAVDLDTGAIVAVTLQSADRGDTTTIVETVTAAAEQVEDAQRDGEGRWCGESELARNDPNPQFRHRPMPYDTGLPRAVI